MNDQEKAIARACLREVLNALEELRDIPAWWSWMTERNRCEYKEFQAWVGHKLNELE